MISPRHQAAKDLAECGIPVFPCLPGRKDPATPHGFLDATTDQAIIDAWWGVADYNVAFEPGKAGLCVVDVDDKAGKSGSSSLFGLEMTYGELNPGFVVNTPSGGRHLYFKGSMAPSANKLGDGLDIRGERSYVLLPPSIVGGKLYTSPSPLWAETWQLDQVPSWIKTAVASPVTYEARDAAEGIEIDSHVNFVRAETYLMSLADEGDVAVAGQGGNDRTFRVINRVMDLGLSPEAACALISAVWNPACIPPWSDVELQTLVRNCAKYRQNQAGCEGVQDGQKAFAVALEALGITGEIGVDPDTCPSITATLSPKEKQLAAQAKFNFRGAEGRARARLTAKKREWLLDGLVRYGETMLIVADPRSFKSFITQHIALSVAHGLPLWGRAVKQGLAVYVAAEGRHGIENDRRDAWENANHIVEDTEDFIVTDGVQVSMVESVEAFIEGLRGLPKQPTLIVLDTMAKCMLGMDENSAKDVGYLTSFVDRLKNEFGCTVIVLHHTAKNGNKVSPRGSGALLGNFDNVLSLTREGKSKVVKVEVQKFKDDEEPEAPLVLAGETEGDSLVFSLANPEVVAEAEEQYSPLSTSNIGRVLADFSEPIGSDVLVRAIVMQTAKAHDTPDDIEHNVAETLKRLNAMIRKNPWKYIAYVNSMPGRPDMWQGTTPTPK